MRLWVGMLLAAIGPLWMTGCGPSDGVRTYPVTGTITFQGEPIESGSIVFDPVDGQGQAAMGGIENGRIVAKVPEGKKVVRISADRITEEKDEYGELVTDSYVPRKYNTNSELQMTVQPDGQNKLELDLE